MWQVKELRNNMLSELGKIYTEQECLSMVNLLLYSVAGIEKKDLILDPGRLVDENTKVELLEKLGELMAYKPIQYVTGTAYFYGLELEVNRSVLIPRPETEELVKWVADENQEKPGLKILDIGTGSGCIILALGKLLKNPDLTALDTSGKALQTAGRNAEKCRIHASFNKINILEENEWDQLGIYDLIVSNPPYVRESEKSVMQSNVLDYEPSAALFVPDSDPLIFYRAIAKFSTRHLSDNGRLYMEINENLGEEVRFLLEDKGLSDILIRKDMRGKERMVRCIRKN
jgi:release factor glutamine methyltransferase